jgi:hypothetical protein
MQKLLEDLRFFIGAFFLIIGFILLTTGIFSPSYVEGFNLNLITGIVFLIFAMLALALSIFENK